MVIRFTLVTFLMCCPVLAKAQLSGEFYLEKSTFAPGEPIFLYFKVVNDGPRAESLQSADPYSFCAGYQVSVSPDPAVISLCTPIGWGGSCLSSSTVLAPGKEQIERVLLNFDHRVDMPGQYTVDAQRRLSHADGNGDYFSLETVRETLEVHSTLFFEVDANATQDAKALQPWVSQLRSEDFTKRREAARTLASLAPPALQEVLLGFADNPEFKQFAPLAFHRLNTPRSRKALADLLTKAEVGSFEHLKSMDYLAETGDAQWFPLLQDVAEKHAQISTYVNDAAMLGREKMLPDLVALTRSTDLEFTRINAVTGMGYTGSRTAVPILIEFLKRPDADVDERAEAGLQMLTHRTTRTGQGGNFQTPYAQWSQWWAQEGKYAPIYKSTECGEIEPLP